MRMTLMGGILIRVIRSHSCIGVELFLIIIFIFSYEAHFYRIFSLGKIESRMLEKYSPPAIA